MPARAAGASGVRRRRVPLPPIGVGLAAIAVALETIGFVLRQSGHENHVLSMDAPYSFPRLYVAALFAAAGLAAGAVLVAWSHVAPALSEPGAAPAQAERPSGDVGTAEKSCPLRAWPYIG